MNRTTVDGLAPGSDYTFTVWAVGSQELVSNNITCAGSTGISCGVWMGDLEEVFRRETFNFFRTTNSHILC